MIFACFLVLTLLNGNEGSGQPGIRRYWYSPYGEPDTGQHLQAGTNLGHLTIVQCSRFCSDNAGCRSFQFHKTGQHTGECYTFPTLTYNAIMAPSPGHVYFEKRSCLEVRHFTAAVMYPSAMRLILFTADWTYLLNVIEEGEVIKLNWLTGHQHTAIFPGISGTVDGAFQGTSGSTYIVQGNQVRCYKPKSATIKEFDACTPGSNDVLQHYFATNSYLDAVVALDDTGSEVHVFTNNVVYRHTWSGNVYNAIDSFPISDTRNDNIWIKAVVNMTALSQLPNNNVLLIEDFKMLVYSKTTRRVSGITVSCISN